MKKIFLFIFLGMAIIPGFSQDEEADAIAAGVLKAMGGQKNWDKTRHIRWDFFGRRTLLWDKWTGDVRIDIPKDTIQLYVNVHTKEGKAYKGGIEIADTTKRNELIYKAWVVWINDSYWLVMPFKLKDAGVNLKYLGEEKSEAGIDSWKLELTFNNVGPYPEHKYDVWVNKENHLVCQWAFYESVDKATSDMINPWDDYKKYGKIMLSGGRGENSLDHIRVYKKLDPKIYTDFSRKIPD